MSNPVGKKKKDNINWSSAEFAQRVVMVKDYGEVKHYGECRIKICKHVLVTPFHKLVD